MSYILDALKKSEQERRRGKAPDFLDDHGQAPQRPRRRFWGYMFFLGLVIVAGGLGWWFGHDEPATDKLPFQSSGARPAPSLPPQTAVLPSAPAPKPAAEMSAAKPEPASRNDIRATAARKPVKPPSFSGKASGEQSSGTADVAQSGTVAAKKPDPDKIYSLNELPDTVNREIPSLSISTHIYSPNPSERLASINGNIGREGQEIIQGIILESVQPEGVILRHRGYRFRVDLR
jgi:general secretion pathway protein B